MCDVIPERMHGPERRRLERADRQRHTAAEDAKRAEEIAEWPEREERNRRLAAANARREAKAADAADAARLQPLIDAAVKKALESKS